MKINLSLIDKPWGAKHFELLSHYKLDTKSRIQLHRLLKKIGDELTLYQAVLRSKIRAYNYVDDKGNPDVPPENKIEYYDFVNELGTKEFEVEFDLINLTAFAENNKEFDPTVTGSLSFLFE